MIDESCGEEAKRALAKTGIRTAVMCSLEMKGTLIPKNPIQRASEIGWLIRYAIDGGFTTKRRTPMDIEKLSTAWVSAIVGMCTAHDKDTYDAHDAKADELLTPILAAPVKQLREFYHVLSAKLRAEPKVPFLVWISFEAWGEAVVKNAPDEAVKRLKRKLASDISDLVELELRDQWPEAIKRALMWRDPEVLEEVKTRLEAGEKPKIRGRQSCLFLEVGRGDKKVSAML